MTTSNNGSWKNAAITALLAIVLSSVAWAFTVGNGVAINKTEIANLKEQYNTIDTKLDDIIKYQRDHK